MSFANAKYVIYANSMKGNDSRDGMTADSAVETINRALEIGQKNIFYPVHFQLIIILLPNWSDNQTFFSPRKNSVKWVQDNTHFDSTLDAYYLPPKGLAANVSIRIQSLNSIPLTAILDTWSNYQSGKISYETFKTTVYGTCFDTYISGGDAAFIIQDWSDVQISGIHFVNFAQFSLLVSNSSILVENSNFTKTGSSEVLHSTLYWKNNYNYGSSQNQSSMMHLKNSTATVSNSEYYGLNTSKGAYITIDDSKVDIFNSLIHGFSKGNPF